MKKLKDALLRLISQKPNPITIPPPSDPSTDRAVGTTMALLDEVILIYPNGQTPTQIDPHRQLMRSWHYDMPNGYWGAWDTQFYFTADFHYGNQLAVRLPRVRADDDPALHRPWNKKPDVTVQKSTVDSLATVRAAINAMSTHMVGPWPTEIVVQVLNAAPAIAELCVEVERLTTELESSNRHRQQAEEDDQHSLSTWLRLLKAVDPKAENTDDALRTLAGLRDRITELEARPTSPLVAPGIDLAEVKAAEQAMTKAPWRPSKKPSMGRGGDGAVVFGGAKLEDRDGIIALRNAAPKMFAEVQMLRDEVARRRATADKMLTSLTRLDESSNAEIVRLTERWAKVEPLIERLREVAHNEKHSTADLIEAVGALLTVAMPPSPTTMQIVARADLRQGEPHASFSDREYAERCLVQGYAFCRDVLSWSTMVGSDTCWAIVDRPTKTKP